MLDAIEGESTHVEDTYQAQVCIGWLHWVVGEYNLAAIRLPQSLNSEHTRIESFEKVSDWSKVCALKSTYFRANYFSRTGRRADAIACFEAALPHVLSVLTVLSSKRQIQYWSELFLTEFCFSVGQALEDKEKSLDEANCIASFRVWAKYWESGTGQPLQGGCGFLGSVSRRKIWHDYYLALSSILVEDLPFPTENAPITLESSAKSQLRVELKKVEATYEALLLGEVQFPRAEENRNEVECFVHIVMRNWVVMTGKSWRDSDLRPGGKEAISRGVLDILYRTATKTYHSTAILRHLFTVHLSVAEFDLAMKAFESYMDIMKKGKARIAKTGHLEVSLDNDAQFLEAIAQCVTALCRYGGRAAAERARELGQELEYWLNKFTTSVSTSTDNTVLSPPKGNGETPAAGLESTVPSNVLAFSWFAIGLSQAQWSRMTLDAITRPEIQLKAEKSLRKALSPELGASSDIRRLFTLGLVLAERREITAAIETIKTALLASQPPSEDHGPPVHSYLQERLLIPVWHLLALLLSARHENVMAARACEGAFEQFKDPLVLFGTTNLKEHFHSQHLNEAEMRGDKPQLTGLVDEMDDYERESILEVKMTQLALVEIMEGPEVAVNASYELLALFSRLFGKINASVTMKPPKSSMLAPPKSSTGTFQNIKGTIFGSNRSDQRGRQPSFRSTNFGDSLGVDDSDRPMPMQTTISAFPVANVAPSIQVTLDNGLTSEMGQKKRSKSARRGNSLKKREPSRKRAISISSSFRRPSLIESDSSIPIEALGNDSATYDFFTFSSKNQTAETQSQQYSRSLSFRSGTASNKASSQGLALNPPAFPSLLPTVQFSNHEEKRRRTTMLIKVWLAIARLYRKAHMLEDCRGAIGEAQKYTQLLEKDVTKDINNEISATQCEWAGNMSVEELHGDCWTEVCIGMAVL